MDDWLYFWEKSKDKTMERLAENDVLKPSGQKEKEFYTSLWRDDKIRTFKEPINNFLLKYLLAWSGPAEPPCPTKWLKEQRDVVKLMIQIVDSIDFPRGEI